MSSLSFGAACLFWILTQPNVAKTPAVDFEEPRAKLVDQPVTPAQAGTSAAKSGREFFVSWGYNGDQYTKSDLHIAQPSLGNDFTLLGVKPRDSKPWGNIIGHSLFVPQYNVRAGIFFNERWGLELALDHMKWIVRQDQEVPITGTLNGTAVDGPVTLTEDVLRYQLNNGANPIFVNVIRRVRLRGEPTRTGSISFLAKAGGGFAVPHTENTVFGQPNEKGFQFLHGWDVDASAAARIHIFKALYFEFEEKLVYVRYFGVNVDEGTARHSVKANEITLNLGMAFR
jgi:hypothetical protein